MDPYKVLGVNPGASDEDVKAAYRDLVRKYHPDNYHDNPLADLAEERMKEINLAYDQIQRDRRGGNTSAQNGGYSSGNGNPAYQNVRRMIEINNLQAAESMLLAMSERDAEWYFLYGNIYYRRGWFQQAAQYFETASRMQPSNREYAEALKRMQTQQPVYRQRNSGGLSGCDICTGLLCADCCCECMGGDLIRCC